MWISLTAQDSWGIRENGQRDRTTRGLVDVTEQSGLGDLAVSNVPYGCDKRVLAQGHNAGRHGEAFQQGEEPVDASVVAEAVDLRKVERQVLCLDAVQDLGLSLRDHLVVIPCRGISVSVGNVSGGSAVICTGTIVGIGSGTSSPSRTCRRQFHRGPRLTSRRRAASANDAPSRSTSPTIRS